MNVLTVEGQPSAFLYGYHYQGNVTALRTGFDASHDNGIGSALMLQAIQDSCNRGDRTIDFGPGEREHKRRLRTRTESTYRLTYTPIDSWRSQAVRLSSRWAKRAGRNGQKRCAELRSASKTLSKGLAPEIRTSCDRGFAFLPVTQPMVATWMFAKVLRAESFNTTPLLNLPCPIEKLRTGS